MSLDGFVLRAIIHEWQTLVGGKINKIQQPNPHDILLQIRVNGETSRLLISANPTYPRAHLTTHTFVNPPEAPMFCMILRKYCENAVIVSIKQINLERIIHIELRHRDEIGDVRNVRIIVELMGRHSNIILTDSKSGEIIDGIHHVTPALSSYRVVMPTVVYLAPPEQNKHNPLEITKPTFLQLFLNSLHSSTNSQSTLNLQQILVQQLSGMSPLFAEELLHRSKLQGEMNVLTDEQLNSLWHIFSSAIQMLKQHQYEPQLIQEKSNEKSFFYITSLTHKAGQTIYFAFVQQCIEKYFHEKTQRDTIKQRSSDLKNVLQNELQKNLKKIEKLNQSLQEAQEAEQFRIAGELLTAHLHLVQKGLTSIKVTNYYDDNQQELSLSLDPLLTPAENAQRYFKKYTKLKNSNTQIDIQLSQTNLEIEYLRSVFTQLENASLQDIEEIRQELIQGKYLRNRKESHRKNKKQDKPKISCFLSSEGIEIFVGKNNIQNDYLTQKFAHPQDTWLHTQAIPGSHVVIRSQIFSETTLHEAAQLAAYFSQARHSSSVPVDYTKIKHVHKPNGAKPGYVIYDHQKTIYVTPNESFIETLHLS